VLGRRLFLADPHPGVTGKLPPPVFALNAAIVLVICDGHVTVAAVDGRRWRVAGFLGGVIAPSRDMLVRKRSAPRARPAGPSVSSLPDFNLKRHLQPAAVRLDHGPEHAALGIRRLRRLHDSHGPAGAVQRARPAKSWSRQRRRTADATLSLIPDG